MKPIILDLFCGAGGAAAGYVAAGFDVVGVDIEPQARYPFPFVQADALENDLDLTQFAAIHASPPLVEAAGEPRRPGRRTVAHLSLAERTRLLLEESGRPYVIEMAHDAMTWTCLTLCGSMFHMPYQRHCRFHSSFLIRPLVCNHLASSETCNLPRSYNEFLPHDNPRRQYGPTVLQAAAERSLWGSLLGIGWMIRRELANATPPIYTEFLGTMILAQLDQEKGRW